MKFTVCLLLLTISRYVWSERSYDIVLDRADIVYYNHDIFHNFSIVFFDYEPLHQRRVNFSATLKKDLIGNDFKAESRILRFQGSEYKSTPTSYTGNPCVDFKEKNVGHKLDKSRMITNLNDSITCTFPKGYYYVFNAYGDESRYPPYAPVGKYLIDHKLYHNTSIFLIHTKTYIEIKSRKNAFLG